MMHIDSIAEERKGLVDCDVHPTIASLDLLLPFMSGKTAQKIKDLGTFRNAGTFLTGPFYPRMHEGALRQDAAPTSGGKPGTDPAFMLEHHLVPNNISDAVLFPIMAMQASDNREIAVAFCRAVNEWLSAHWLDFDPRFRGTILVPMEHVDAAVAEIRYWRDDPRFIQVGIPSRASSLLGHPRYWPIYEAAVEADIALGVHPHAGDSVAPLSSGGWPSFYVDEMMHFSVAYQAQLTSLISSGLFEHLPTIRIGLIEGGFGWAAPMAWRLDKIWKLQNCELPSPGLLPSGYLKKHVWFASQPIEEYRTSKDLNETIDFLGWDKIVFSSDYPHWDNDDISYISAPFSNPERIKLFGRGNSSKLYGSRL